jgi:hypothetical protein
MQARSSENPVTNSRYASHKPKQTYVMTAIGPNHQQTEKPLARI